MDRPVTIAFINALPGWGGGEKWFLHAAAAMAARGWRALVIGQPEGELVRRARGLGLETRGVPMHGIADPRTLLAMGRLLRREDVSLAFANQAREIRLAGLSQLGRRDFRLIVRRGSPDPIKDVWHFRYVYTRLVDRLLVNCEALVPRVCGGAPWFDRAKVRVIPNGVEAAALRAAADADRVRPALDLRPGAPVIAMIGEVGWRKDQATLLEALARLAPDRDFTALIAGEGPDRAALERRTAELGLTDRVRWLGFRTDAADLMAASDLLALPTREEGFPNTLLEAMALGLPVVSTPVDGIPELVLHGETGLLVPPQDPAALAAALAALLDDPSRRRVLGEAGRRRAETEFDQTRIMDRVDALIRETLADGR
ncbi:MAG TPA: glycosyltransferase [Candidatus Krumholzibacteria bacterium]|nr:glycosyltransferase [Candidatus Krumholzibacteria bacterium]HRX51784.1 glycosyltransferase [Candidatus Krumholzibacteria bacterium]